MDQDMPLQIREAEAADYEGLCVLFAEGDALHRENVPWVFRKAEGAPRTEERVRELIGDEAVALFVAQTAEGIVGLLHIRLNSAPDYPLFRPRHYAVVENVVVLRGLHGRGIGQSLMKTAQAWAEGKGAESIELNVWSFNESAIRFYEALGYETVSRKMHKRLG